MKTVNSLLLIPIIFLAACASNPHKAKQLDDQILVKGTAGNGIEVGIKNDEMVVQSKVLLVEELRTLMNSTYEIEAKVYGGERYLDNNGLYGVLKNCYKEQAEVTGDLVPMAEDRAYVVPEDEYEMGLDSSKNLIGLHREYLKDRMSRFKDYKKALLKRQSEYENKIDLCRVKTSVAAKQ